MPSNLEKNVCGGCGIRVILGDDGRRYIVVDGSRDDLLLLSSRWGNAEECREAVASKKECLARESYYIDLTNSHNRE